MHDAEIHLVHIREGTDADLLVVGIFLDAGAYGSNVEVNNACCVSCRLPFPVSSHARTGEITLSDKHKFRHAMSGATVRYM